MYSTNVHMYNVTYKCSYMEATLSGDESPAAATNWQAKAPAGRCGPACNAGHSQRLEWVASSSTAHPPLPPPNAQFLLSHLQSCRASYITDICRDRSTSVLTLIF